MDKCKKCGSSKIKTSFVPKGALIDSSARGRSDSEFVDSSEYAYSWKWTASREHLVVRCENCGFKSRVKCLDA